MPNEETLVPTAARISSSKGLLSKATWDTRETVDWIIYRGSEHDEMDVALTQGVHMNDDVMECLRARAKGDPRSWAPDAPPSVGPTPAPQRYSGKYQFHWGSRIVGLDGDERVFTAASCRARMRRWMRDMEMSAPELFAHGDALRKWANKAIEAQNAAYEAALAKLNNAARGGLLAVRGCKRFTVSCPSCKPVREDIPKEQFDDIRQINVLGAISVHDVSNSFAFLGQEPPSYWSLEYNPHEVRGLWPAPEQEAEAEVVHHLGAPPVDLRPLDRHVAVTDCGDTALDHANIGQRPPSRAETRRWLEDRYKHLSQDARLPPEAPEMADAVKALPGLSRQLFRDLINEVRPDRSRKTGRPAKSVNSPPENSRRRAASFDGEFSAP